MKTIFYKKSEDENGDYWFGSIPYKEWFTLENTLYDPNGSIVKKTIVPKDNTKYVERVVLNTIEDMFSDDGIVRRIALYISK